MARAVNLAGQRYGNLVVVDIAEPVSYGGRFFRAWVCRCDCGNKITLPSIKLPWSTGSIRAANRAGRLLYTCCEECRKKTCLVCGERFSYSVTSKYTCTKKSCRRTWQDDREKKWHEIAARRYRSDPAYRQAVREYQNEYYRDNSRAVVERRNERLSQMTDDERTDWERKNAERRARYYQRIKSDPQKYARRLAMLRRLNNEAAARRFLRTAEKLIEKMENQNAK